MGPCKTGIMLGGMMGAGIGGSAGIILGGAGGFFSGYRGFALLKQSAKLVDTDKVPRVSKFINQERLADKQFLIFLICVGLYIFEINQTNSVV